MSKRSASRAQLARALSASHCLLTDWRPTAADFQIRKLWLFPFLTET
jgi:hypothetical protein